MLADKKKPVKKDNVPDVKPDDIKKPVGKPDKPFDKEQEDDNDQQDREPSDKQPQNSKQQSAFKKKANPLVKREPEQEPEN